MAPPRAMTLVVVLVFISFAGCTYPQGKEVSISFHGSVNETGSGVEIDGELAAGGGIFILNRLEISTPREGHWHSAFRCQNSLTT